jgi:hypothetical protein
MRNLLSVLLYWIIATLISSSNEVIAEVIANEAKKLKIGFMTVPGSESYDAFRLAINNLDQNKILPSLIRLNNCIVSKQDNNINIIFIDSTDCKDKLKAIIDDNNMKNSLLVSFATPSNRQQFAKIPEQDFNKILLIRFKVDLPPSKLLEEIFSEKYNYIPKSDQVVPTYEAARILLKAIDMSPDLSLNNLRTEVDKFKIVRVEAAPLRTTSESSDKLQGADKILTKGDIVIQQGKTQNNYLKVESFSAPTQGNTGWIQKRLIK